MEIKSLFKSGVEAIVSAATLPTPEAPSFSFDELRATLFLEDDQADLVATAKERIKPYVDERDRHIASVILEIYSRQEN